MSGSDKFEDVGAGRDRDMAVPETNSHIPLDNILRSRLEGVFVSPCGTEGCRWEGFPEWPEEFPYDAFGDAWSQTGDKEHET
jgi:hypothetical protein